MLDVLEWVKKRIDETAGPRSGRPTGADSLPNMLSADPATALAELRVRLRAEGEAPGNAGARSAAHARIQDTGAPHVAALLSQYLIDAAGTHAAREAAWKSLIGYQLRLAQALCASAGAALTAASAARARPLTLASVSPKRWRRSEWPTITAVAPASASISAEISPVWAPEGKG